MTPSELPAHSRLGASNMKRWRHCPGSVAACEGFESKSSSYAEEGTRAHDAAAKCLEEGVDAGIYCDSPDMAEAVQGYLDRCRGIQAADPGTTLIEHKFHLVQIDDALFGTADFVHCGLATRTLYVRDYKHGAGVAVEVVDEDGEVNDQLMYYATGALLEVQKTFRPEWIDIGIVQPRCPHEDGPVRTRRVHILEMLAWIDMLENAVAATRDPLAPRCAGSWCRWCQAAAMCPKLRDHCNKVAAMEFRNDCSYDPTQLANVLDELPVLEAFVKSVREFAYGEAEHGRTPPRYKLVEKQARRKWKDEKEAAEYLGLMGFQNIEIFEEPALKSPAQMEKSLGKEQKALIAPLVFAESSGLALVHESDKRPPAKIAAADAFKEFASPG